MHNKQKKIAVINDISGFGKCSLSVSLPVISAMKIQCCPLPTSVFSNHTGFESFFYTDFTEYMSRYIDEWEKLGLKFAGILSGFLDSEKQIEIVKDFIERFKTRDTITVIDPVMGDYGKLYPTYSRELAKKMKLLVPYADILTPNLTEACILTDTPYTAFPEEALLFSICENLSRMGPEKIVISGLESGEDLVNYVFERGEAPKTVRAHKVGVCRSGTGDVFSSIIAGDAVNGVGFFDSVKHACEFIEKALKRTVELGTPVTDGICFEEFLKEL